MFGRGIANLKFSCEEIGGGGGGGGSTLEMADEEQERFASKDGEYYGKFDVLCFVFEIQILI